MLYGPLGRSWDVEGPFLSVCESCRILEYLGGDDPLLILHVNRSRSIGTGAYILIRPGLLGFWAVLSFPPWFSSALDVLSSKSFPDGLGMSRAIEGCPPLLSWAPSFCPNFYGFFYVCLGLVAFSNPGFHLDQTSGLSQAIFPGIRLGGFDPSSWDRPLGPLWSFLWGIAYHAPPSPACGGARVDLSF